MISEAKFDTTVIRKMLKRSVRWCLESKDGKIRDE